MATSIETRTVRRGAGIGVSLRQQTVLLGVSGRWVYLVLGLLALLMLIGLSGLPREVPRMLVIAQLALLGGVTWAVMVWFGEGPDRRSYHWSFPVPRPAHDLSRVGGGVVYLVGICAVLAAAGAVAASMNGTFDRFATFGAESWASFFVTPLIVYLLVTPVVLWSDYAITRWAFGTVFGLALLAVILAWQGFHLPADLMRTIVEAEQWGLGPALFDWTLHMVGPTPVDANWPAAALWLALGFALTLVTGMYRPEDLQRLVRRAAGN